MSFREGKAAAVRTQLSASSAMLVMRALAKQNAFVGYRREEVSSLVDGEEKDPQKIPGITPYLMQETRREEMLLLRNALDRRCAMNANFSYRRADAAKRANLDDRGQNSADAINVN